MGYYTEFTLTVEHADHKGKPVPQILTATEIERIDCEVAKMRCFDDENFEQPVWTGYGRWYSSEQDMLLLSRKFPEFVFHLHGEGENRDDIWEEHFWNGFHQRYLARVVLDPYNPAELIAGVGIPTKYSYQEV